MTNEELQRRAEDLAADVMGDYAEMLPRFVDAMREAVAQTYEEAAQAEIPMPEADSCDNTYNGGYSDGLQAAEEAYRAHFRALKDQLVPEPVASR